MYKILKYQLNPSKTRASVAQEATHSGDTNTPELHSEEIRLQVKWPKSSDTKAYQELKKEVLKKFKRLKRGLSNEQRLEALSDTIYSFGSDKFDVQVRRPQEPKKHHPNRRSRKLEELRAQKKRLRKRWLNATEEEKEGIKVLYEDIKAQHRTAMRQERRFQRKKQRRRSCQNFLKNPYGFAKQIFVESKSGKLNCTQRDLEDHLKKTYCDPTRHENPPAMSGIPCPTRPGSQFDMGELRKKEVDDFFKKARAKSRPGKDCVPYKVYKNCPHLRYQLYLLLKEAWKTKSIAEKWCLAEGVYIPKEQNSEILSQFRPISLLNVDGKVFFGIIAKRMMNFLQTNGYINESIQKAGLPGTPGCVEHSNMIWESIQNAKKDNLNLSVVWLDLANAFGSVPHQILLKAMKTYWIPPEVQDLLMEYYDRFIMRFTTEDFTTAWQRLEIGIAAGCTISVILFLLAMEMILQGTDTNTVQAITSPKKAFMDDITILTEKPEDMEKILLRLDKLIKWARMIFKASKSRSLTLKNGKQISFKYKISNEVMPAIHQKPVKSLGRMYEGNLSDRSKGVQIHREVEEGLLKINKTNLPGKYKLWILQFALYPRIEWPLITYEVGLSRVQTMEQRCNVFIRKWMQLPRVQIRESLYKNNSALQLPTASVEEIFKCGKVRTIMMLRDSEDHTISMDPPSMYTYTKWNAEDATDTAIDSLRQRDIIGAVRTPGGLGSGSFKPTALMSKKERRLATVNEVKVDLAKQRHTRLVQSSVQGQVVSWEDKVVERKLSWKDIWSWTPARLSFLMKSTYDTLPSPSNLVRWKISQESKCKCGQLGTMRHILSNCPLGLQRRYLWRHNKVLEVILNAIKEKISQINQGNLPLINSSKVVRFCKQGVTPLKKKKVQKENSEWRGTWKVDSDIDNNLIFPIVDTSQKPDLLVYNEERKVMKMIELTVSWETNIDDAFDRKNKRYARLCKDCRAEGWQVDCLPIEVGARGFVGKRVPALLTKIGLNSKERGRVMKDIQEAAEKSSFWIWLKRNDTTWND